MQLNVFAVSLFSNHPPKPKNMISIFLLDYQHMERAAMLLSGKWVICRITGFAFTLMGKIGVDCPLQNIWDVVHSLLNLWSHLGSLLCPSTRARIKTTQRLVFQRVL